MSVVTGAASANSLTPNNYDSVTFTYTSDGFDNIATATFSLSSVQVRVLTYTYNGSGDLTNVAVTA